mmetsp:Transcript_35837/g.54318  ORF Transcript_35837/g.54318 Transcript_35837/m.54318 type:complete len:327 (-) Transcript_35837:645-1625(-)
MIHVMRNNTSKISNPNHLFRGEKVLNVREANEPSTIRWTDLNQKRRHIWYMQLQTAIVSVGVIALIAMFTAFCKKRSTLYAAISISLFNAIFPQFAKYLTSFELHRSEESTQTSLYLKITAFRWVNTAIIITIVTRTWERTPQLGTTLTKCSRKYFFTAIVLAMAISSSYFWSGFPYDNLCRLEGSNEVDQDYVGTWTATTFGNKTIQARVVKEDIAYKFCLQDLLRVDDKVTFPPLPKHQPKGSEWMTPDQEKLVELFGWTSLVLTIAVVIYFACDSLRMVRDLFYYKHECVGKDQKINYSDVDIISAFVPQVESSFFPYPPIML